MTANTDRAETEVWIESFRCHAYIRIGSVKNLATVNDPRMAEVVREALQRYVDEESGPRANGNENLISEEKT